MTVDVSPSLLMVRSVIRPPWVRCLLLVFLLVTATPIEPIAASGSPNARMCSRLSMSFFFLLLSDMCIRL